MRVWMGRERVYKGCWTQVVTPIPQAARPLVWNDALTAPATPAVSKPSSASW